jgi:hypothetical protein
MQSYKDLSERPEFHLQLPYIGSELFIYLFVWNVQNEKPYRFNAGFCIGVTTARVPSLRNSAAKYSPAVSRTDALPCASGQPQVSVVRSRDLSMVSSPPSDI